MRQTEEETQTTDTWEEGRPALIITENNPELQM